MTKITITEALAEIKTIGKRISKKRDFINMSLVRQDGLRDPLEKDGGSAKVVAAERQSVASLEANIIALRKGIQRANDETMVTVNGTSRSISEWLTWRRDVAPAHKAWLEQVRAIINHGREQAKKSGAALISATAAVTSETKPIDFIVSVDEKQIAEEIEMIEEILGTLDGQLSLKNATVMISI